PARCGAGQVWQHTPPLCFRPRSDVLLQRTGRGRCGGGPRPIAASSGWGRGKGPVPSRRDNIGRERLSGGPATPARRSFRVTGPVVGWFHGICVSFHAALGTYGSGPVKNDG